MIFVYIIFCLGLVVLVVAWACCLVASKADDKAERAATPCSGLPPYKPLEPWGFQGGPPLKKHLASSRFLLVLAILWGV